MSTDRKWSISSDGENFSGQYDTLEQAVQEGIFLYGRFWAGQCITPIPPEKLFDRDTIDYWIDGVVEHEDYNGDWANGPWNASRERRAELAEQLQPAIAVWLECNGLRPTHWNIDPMTVRLFCGNEVNDAK